MHGGHTRAKRSEYRVGDQMAECPFRETFYRASNTRRGNMVGPFARSHDRVPSGRFDSDVNLNQSVITMEEAVG